MSGTYIRLGSSRCYPTIVFAIVVEGQRRACFEQRVVSIGRSTRNDLVLPHPDVSRRHAEVRVESAGFSIKDLRSGHGTWIGGARIQHHLLRAGDRITIGPFTFSIEASVTADPVEQRLLDAIAQQNDANSRLVYADWLEQQGDVARAEFLRMQEFLVEADPDSLAFTLQTTKLREVASQIDMKWRHAVARPAVEGCNQRFTVRCPKEWGSLAPTERPNVRHCETCRKHVYYCATVAEARDRVERDECVAVDIIPKRRVGDLAPEPEIMMGRYAPPGDS
jgi:uncharacterized protein (TIGR02996 family)